MDSMFLEDGGGLLTEDGAWSFAQESASASASGGGLLVEDGFGFLLESDEALALEAGADEDGDVLVPGGWNSMPVSVGDAAPSDASLVVALACQDAARLLLQDGYDLLSQDSAGGDDLAPLGWGSRPITPTN